LLRGVLGHDDAVLAGAAALLAPRAEATALVSVIERDGVPGIASAPTRAPGSNCARRGPLARRNSPRRRGPSGCAPVPARGP
jgi:hypothetical protein